MAGISPCRSQLCLRIVPGVLRRLLPGTTSPHQCPAATHALRQALMALLEAVWQEEVGPGMDTALLMGALVATTGVHYHTTLE